jgi:REP element-mobilizing transposase RayT
MKTQSNEYHFRKSPRSQWLDYSVGDFFVTICTDHRIPYFGIIQHDKMILTSIGMALEQAIHEITLHNPYAEPMQWVVMPNHVHMIIRIDGEDLQNEALMRSALSVVVGGVKRAVTMAARNMAAPFDWQSRYHDHLIRNNEEENRIADYIDGNVINWALDRFYEE